MNFEGVLAGLPDAVIAVDAELRIVFWNSAAEVLTERSARRAEVADIAASFQATVVKMLVRKTVKAALHHGIKRIVLTGGVAANGPLRAGLEAAAIEHGLRLHVPPRHLCTDNAAMITAAGAARLAAGERASLTLNAVPDLTLAS